MKETNVAIIGHTYSIAMKLIEELEKNWSTFYNVVSETIGDTENIEPFNFHIGLNGKQITVYSPEKIEIFLKYRNLIVVDFTSETKNNDYCKRNNIKIFSPSGKTSIEDILEIISLLSSL